MTSLLDEFRSETGRQALCEEVRNKVISELQRNGIALNPNNSATEIVPIPKKYTSLQLRQYQSTKVQFGIERTMDAVREARQKGVSSVETITVEIGQDVTIPGYHFVVGFWKN